MINVIEPAVFGAVQGLAEFLPISSSGHLLLLHSVTHFSIGDDLTFDVALHLGTLVALVVYFWRELWSVLRAWLRSFRSWNVQQDAQQRLAWLLIIASIPGAIAGVLLESAAETAFRSPVLVACTLILAGVALWAADRWSTQERSLEQIGWRQALLIGIAQAVAVVPGVSRSGATIALARVLKFSRETAARFSFLMSAPILAGAGAKKLFELRHASLTSTQQWDFLIGVVVAAIVGWFAIRVLLRYISRHSYSIFAWYRLALGVLTLIIVYLTR